ncbi:DUF4174 domain-containing protein [Teichococcus oryzae]|uniref:DUF4174 domain-containing protein n=1 Tax=Teichococcus oryzae TaxID=1608942 RepID=A0A5B2T9S4_9PROT|nr:DUF4174 domain-containing protein [Pseudoroseomonas oryzae]KAA2211352.1 DUF4174 domain-containing protein [Pseudoroseomonas oryzae]
MAEGITRRAAAGLAMAAAGLPAGAAALAPFTWKNRVLVVFAPAEGAELREQRRLLAADRPDFEARDMVVLAVIGADRLEVLLSAAQGAGAPVSPQVLRERFGVPPEQPFAAVLVGKDGGEKWRAAHPAGPDALWPLIDAMPMRRNEAERGG